MARVLTPEEVEERRKKKCAKAREWNRLHKDDPEVIERRRKAQREYIVRRYASNEAYREAQKARSREYYEKKKILNTIGVDI